MKILGDMQPVQAELPIATSEQLLTPGILRTTSVPVPHGLRPSSLGHFTGYGGHLELEIWMCLLYVAKLKMGLSILYPNTV